nr:hypothetical protein [Candidatus Sigynarchaeota archaeon]
MTDQIEKMMEEQRKELIAAGEIGPDEKLSLREISKRYTLYQIKKSQGNLKRLGLTASNSPSETLAAQKKIVPPRKNNTSEIEAARQTFLDNSDVDPIVFDPNWIKTLEKMKQDGGAPATRADTGPHKVAKPAARTEIPNAAAGTSKPLEGLVYAIEQLVAQGKEGYNACLLVVDGCWISISCKPKKKQLYIQVAGDKYIPKKSALRPEHVKKLEGMKITREEGSIDIFSIHYGTDEIDIPKIAQDVFLIFDEVLRVSKGAVAYMQYNLVPKPTPEYEAVLAALAQFIPDRREKNKFYWKWT